MEWNNNMLTISIPHLSTSSSYFVDCFCFKFVCAFADLFDVEAWYLPYISNVITLWQDIKTLTLFLIIISIISPLLLHSSDISYDLFRCPLQDNHESWIAICWLLRSICILQYPFMWFFRATMWCRRGIDCWFIVFNYT